MAQSNFAYPIKHDDELTSDMLKSYYVSKIHLTGIKCHPLDKKVKRYPMHWRITAECKPVKIVEPPGGPKMQKKDGKSTATDSKSKATKAKTKAQDATKAKKKQKKVFIAIDTKVFSASFERRNVNLASSGELLECAKVLSFVLRKLPC